MTSEQGLYVLVIPWSLCKDHIEVDDDGLVVGEGASSDSSPDNSSLKQLAILAGIYVLDMLLLLYHWFPDTPLQRKFFHLIVTNFRLLQRRVYHVDGFGLFYFPLYSTEPNFLTRYGDGTGGGLVMRVPISFCQELKLNMSYLNRLVGKVDKHVV